VEHQQTEPQLVVALVLVDFRLVDVLLVVEDLTALDKTVPLEILLEVRLQTV
jgi:hypothetical protein